MIKAFAPIFVSATGLVIILFVLLPSWQEIKNLQTLKINKIQTLEDFQSWTEYFDKLSERYRAAESDLEKLSLTVPQEPQVAEILIQIESIMRRNGFLATDIQFSVPEQSVVDLDNKNRMKVANFTLKMGGSYENFKNFIRDIEQNIRLMDISEASLSAKDSKEEGAGGDSMQFEVKFSTYYYEDN